jgi:hypothetical protein
MDMPMDENMGESPEATEAAPAADLSAGFCVEIHVTPDGSFFVVGPEPIDEAEEQGEQGESFDSIGAALKELLRIVRENPITGGEQADFDAGYLAR